jgi:PKHD-type hydroxylase
MILQVAHVLTAAEIGAIRAALAEDASWRDGASTAKGRARTVKNNEQAFPESPSVKGVLQMIRDRLLAHETVAAAAQPAAIARLMLNRYGEGMSYGSHVDAPYIDGVRTDVSFTLFLSDPADYEGGELVIDTAGAEDAVKLPAGAVVLYPATAVHRVEKVRRGERIAAVGWIRSHVRLAEHRAMIFELESAIASLAGVAVPNEVRDRLANLRNNLLRTFGD